MYIVRDIFQLKFGHYQDVKALLDDAINRKLLPQVKAQRILTDFTGNAYRLIWEEGYDNLADYEKTLAEHIGTEEWQQWYLQFKIHVAKGHREILKVIV